MFSIHKFLIAATSIVFTGLGIWLMLDPVKVELFYPLTLDAPMAVSEIRAVFGGMMFGIGAAILWLLWGAKRPLDAGMSMILVFGGLVLARVVGVIFEGMPSGPVLNETVFEITMLALLLLTRRGASDSGG